MAGKLQRLGPWAAALAVVVAATACTGQTIGVAQPGPTTAAVQTSVVPDGSDGTVPQTAGETGDAGESPSEILPPDEYRGRVLESLRIADQMPLVSSVEATLVVAQSPVTPMVTSFPDFVALFSSTQVDLIQRSGFVAGFVATRHDSAAQMSLSLTVLEFETSDQAAVVAASLPFAPNSTPLATSTPGSVASEVVMDEGRTVSVAGSAGPLLFYSQTWTVPGIDGLPLAEKGLSALADAMTGFRPSTPEMRLNLMTDPGGLVSHTLADEQEQDQLSWMGPQGALHLQPNQARAAVTFDNAGVDMVTVFGRTMVLRAADAPRATLLAADTLATAAADNDARVVDIPGLPDGAGCVRGSGPKLNCVGTHDRYAFIFNPTSESEALEIAVRQYELLLQL